MLHINANSTTANYSLAAKLSGVFLIFRQNVPLRSRCVNEEFRETRIALFPSLREISAKVISVEERTYCNGKIIVDGLQINSLGAFLAPGTQIHPPSDFFSTLFQSVRFHEEHVSVKRDNLLSGYPFGVAIFSYSLPFY